MSCSEIDATQKLLTPTFQTPCLSYSVSNFVAKGLLQFE